MTYNIELTERSYVFAEGSEEPFIISSSGNNSEPLTLYISSKKYDLSRVRIVFSNGMEIAEVRLNNTQGRSCFVTVPARLLKAGCLDITITLRGGTLVLKKWVVTPIRILETDEGVQLSSYVKELENKIRELKTEVENLTIRVTDLEEKNTNLFKL